MSCNLSFESVGEGGCEVAGVEGPEEASLVLGLVDILAWGDNGVDL